MARGGARSRSGPLPDPSSGRSERRGVSLSSLPADGFGGEVPEFPLGARAEDESGLFDRELEIWAEAWSTPQAAAWALEPWRWPVIGEYCRLKADVEASPSASAALVGQLHRYREQIGLTPIGLRLNGWAISAVAPAVEADDSSNVVEMPKRRLRG